MAEGQSLFGRRKNGTEFPAEVSLSPIETEGGMLISSAIRDISSLQNLKNNSVSMRTDSVFWFRE